MKSAALNRRETWIWLGFTLAFIVLARFFPLSGDDWQWGVTNYFETFNGRYIGNYLVRLLTQVLWLRPLVVGLSIFAIAFAIVRLSGKGSMLPTLFFLTLTPTATFTQVFQWVSGFCNFTVPVVLLLYTLLLWQLLPSIARKWQAGIYLAAFLLAFSTQFFAEHISVFTVLITALFLGYNLRLHKKLNTFAAVCFAGYLAGAVIMFANPCYWAADPTNAHSMPMFATLLYNLVKNYFTIIAPNLIMDNLWLNLILCAILIRFIKVSANKGRRPTAFIVYFCVFLAYSFTRSLHSAVLQINAVRLFEGMLAASYCVMLVLAVLFFIPKGTAKHKLYFALLSLVILNGPLFIVEPIGARCFFVSYVIFILIANILLEQMAESGLDIPCPGLIKNIMGGIIVFSFFFYFVIYGYTSLIYKERQESLSLQLEQGSQTISVRAVPFYDYVWHGDPSTDYLAIIYKNYYRIPAECYIEMYN